MLTTLLGPALQPGAPSDDNITVRVNVINGTEMVSLFSYGTIVTIITPPQYACNVSLHALMSAAAHAHSMLALQGCMGCNLLLLMDLLGGTQEGKFRVQYC